MKIFNIFFQTFSALKFVDWKVDLLSDDLQYEKLEVIEEHLKLVEFVKLNFKDFIDVLRAL